jgi:hypothetical protein
MATKILIEPEIDRFTLGHYIVEILKKSFGTQPFTIGSLQETLLALNLTLQISEYRIDASVEEVEDILFNLLIPDGSVAQLDENTFRATGTYIA